MAAPCSWKPESPDQRSASGNVPTVHDSYMRTNQPHGGIASPGSGGFAPYRDAEPAEHRGPCWAAAIGRHSRGREHDTDYEVIIREALADLVEHPENCRCVRRGGRR